MVDKLRRNIIALSTSGCVVTSSPTLGSIFVNKDVSGQTLAFDEYRQVYTEWINEVGCEPLEYLSSLGVYDLNNKKEIKALVIQDFSSGNIINIQGFVLSKVEASIIASIGKNYGNIK